MNQMELLKKLADEAKAKKSTSDSIGNTIIKLNKPGKIEFQLIAPAFNEEIYFKKRQQHVIPVSPDNVNDNEKTLFIDCKGDNCPVCKAAENTIEFFKNNYITLDDINNAFDVKYPYKNYRKIFTQTEHYLVYAKITKDSADKGTYIPEGFELNKTYIIQLSENAFFDLMIEYETYKKNNDVVLDLFTSIEDESKDALNIVCQVINPYTIKFDFNGVRKINKEDIDNNKIKFFIENSEVPAEHYEKCVKRIEKIKNYFLKIPTASVNTVTDMDDSDLPFSLGDTPSVKEESTKDSEDDFNIDDLL